MLKSEAATCHNSAESSITIDERALTIEAVSIEFTTAIKEDVRSQQLSTVILEAVGKHGQTKVSVAVYSMHDIYRSPYSC